jgi:hypothetical protein
MAAVRELRQGLRAEQVLCSQTEILFVPVQEELLDQPSRFHGMAPLCFTRSRPRLVEIAAGERGRGPMHIATMETVSLSTRMKS